MVCALSVLALTAVPALAAKHEKPALVLPTDDRGRFDLVSCRVAACWDSARGGFVAKDGVPSESAMELGLLLGAEPTGGEWKRRALSTLEWTQALTDTLNGGCSSRRVEGGAMGEGLVLRTDVNARRLELLLTAWRATGDERYRSDATKVAGFIDRVLLDGRGGFVSAQIGDRTLEPAANGLAIHAWLAWATATGSTPRRDFALRSIERVWTSAFDERGVLLRRGEFGEVIVAPQLSDQVEMGRALVMSSRMCGRPADLERAQTLARTMIAKFEDQKDGGFMTRATPKKDGSIRGAPRREDENARAALFLTELAAATGDETYRDFARRVWVAFAKEQEKPDLAAADWALAFRAALAPETTAPPTWQAAAEENVRPASNILYEHRRVKKKR